MAARRLVPFMEINGCGSRPSTQIPLKSQCPKQTHTGMSEPPSTTVHAKSSTFGRKSVADDELLFKTVTKMISLKHALRGHVLLNHVE